MVELLLQCYRVSLKELGCLKVFLHVVAVAAKVNRRLLQFMRLFVEGLHGDVVCLWPPLCA